MISRPAPLVAIGDLHGHPDLFERLLAWIDQKVPDARIVTLGDYVDNGPQIPALLDRLIALQEARPGRFWPILGNHDLALLRALGWPHADPDPAWYARWASRICADRRSSSHRGGSASRPPPITAEDFSRFCSRSGAAGGPTGGR